MSAISVIWSDANEASARLHEPVLIAQACFGAGESFTWSDAHISLGGTLSNFLPEDRFDNQPLWNPDRSSCLIADVRLDNRADLARTLNLVHPETLADSDFLMAAWLRWGSACLDHVLGSFAFAVWTPSRQELFAARDHAGDRPLFYHRGNGLFALASMPKGLLALPGLARGFQESRMATWLGGIQPDWNTSFFAGIERVPPGHFLRVTPGSLECRQYWHPSHAKPVRFAKDEDYAAALVEILDTATEARLRTNQPIGSFLSAGLDSSSVTASAARLLAAQGKTLTAFTAVPRPGFNNLAEPWFIPSEGEAAANVARLYPNIEHVLVDTTDRDLLSTMKSWTDAMDEPSLNAVNQLWLTAIFEQAKQRGISVLLEGSSGNATISWETWAILGQFFRRMRWLKLARTTLGLRRNGDISFRQAAQAAFTGLLPARFGRTLIPPGRLEALYNPVANPELVRAHDLNRRIFQHRYPDARDLVAEHGRLFSFVDFGPIHAATQALSGVETRDPTSDKRVYDFCFAIPREQYVAGGHSRSLVRRAMKGRLPDSTLLRYQRGHQGADWYLPVSESLPAIRNEIALVEQSRAAQRTLDLTRMHTLVDTFPQSGYEKKQVSEVWHNALLRGVSMGYFLRTHEAAAAAPAIAPAPATPPLK